jgi:hypothetical protein
MAAMAVMAADVSMAVFMAAASTEAGPVSAASMAAEAFMAAASTEAAATIADSARSLLAR